MIKPWVFEFFPELGSEDNDPEPHEVAAYFSRYLDLWVNDEALGFEASFSASTILADRFPHRQTF